MSLRDVIRCRDEKRTGRPHGVPASKYAIFLTEAQKCHALPFLDSKRGLLRFKAMLPGLIKYHAAAGNTPMMVKALFAALDEAGKAAASNTRLKKLRKDHLPYA